MLQHGVDTIDRLMTFDAIEGGLELYHKKPHISTFEYQKTDFSTQPRNLNDIQKLDVAFTISTFVDKQTPMWVGWNSRLLSDNMAEQYISYMENICLPPTRMDVVVETMERSKRVARECSQEDTIGHYDLAIAKIAKTSQVQERPRCDLIHLLWIIPYPNGIFQSHWLFYW